MQCKENLTFHRVLYRAIAAAVKGLRPRTLPLDLFPDMLLLSGMCMCTLHPCVTMFAHTNLYAVKYTYVCIFMYHTYTAF